MVPTVTLTGGSTIAGNGPYVDYNRNYACSDSLTWIKGRHVVKFGYTGNRYNKTENANGNAIGTFTFSNAGVPTGTATFQQAWANFLLGNVATFTQASQDLTPDVWAWQHEAVRAGRFQSQPAADAVHGRALVLLRPAHRYQRPDVQLRSGRIRSGQSAQDRSHQRQRDRGHRRLADQRHHHRRQELAVRQQDRQRQLPATSRRASALAWDPFGTGKTSIRAGYGIYHDAALFGIYEQNMFANPPFVASVTYTNASFNDVSAGTAGIDPLGPNATAVLAPRGTQVPALTPYTQQWSFNIQRQLPEGAVLEVGYFGSKGTHLLGAVDMNQVRPGARSGRRLKTSGTSANAPELPSSPPSDWPRINAIRPFKGFNAFTAIESAFDSNYHSLQVNLRKSFGAAGLDRRGVHLLEDPHRQRLRPQQRAAGRLQLARRRIRTGAHRPAAGTDRQLRLYAAVLQARARPAEHRGRRLAAFRHRLRLHRAAHHRHHLRRRSRRPGHWERRPGQLTPRSDLRPEQGRAAHLWRLRTEFGARPDLVQYRLLRRGAAGRRAARQCRPLHGSRSRLLQFGYSILKNFNISKEGQWKLQLRAETFNTLNWVNPSGFASANNTATIFGQISSFRAARRMQLGAKINF